MAIFAPTHMKSILAAFARFHISSANTDVVLHAYGFLILSKLDLAVLGDLNFAFGFSFSFSLSGLVLAVLDNGFGSTGS